MSCLDPNTLAALVDGTLAEADRVRAVDHLDDCTPCSDLAGELAWVLAPSRVAPPGFRLLRDLGAQRWEAVRDGAVVTIEFATVPEPDATLAAARRTHPALVPIVEAGTLAQEVFVAYAPVAIAPQHDWQRVLGELAALHARGIAIAPEPDRITTDVTFLPRLRGEPRYAAPEVLHGAAPTPASDQFGVCVAMWASRAGRPPFRGATPGQLAVAALSPPTLPPADRATFAVLARGLSADPEARWPDIGALARALADPPRSIFARWRALIGSWRA